MGRPLAIKSWAKQALNENRQDEMDLRALEKELADEDDPRRRAEVKKRIDAMKKRVAGAKR